MDKAEYQDILDQIQNSVNKRDYKKAYELAKSVDWKRVKSFRTLNMIADIYDVNKDYEAEKEVLVIAKNRASVGKGILYRLVEVSLKLGDVEDANKYFDAFVKAAPNDNGRLLLEYQILKASNQPLERQIDLLEEYKRREYTEKWAYELALLYSKDGNREKCVEVCDDMILWFSEGKYVLRAMELKQRYVPLTPSQQDYFDKEQRDSDPRLFSGKKSFATGILEIGAKKEVPAVTAQLPKIPDEVVAAGLKASETQMLKKDPASVLERMEAAGAKVTKSVEYQATSSIQLSAEDIDKLSVTSPMFMGKEADLTSMLEKSKEAVYGKPEDAPVVEAAPVIEEVPVVEAAPVIEEEPVVEEASVVIEPVAALVEEPAEAVSEVTADPFAPKKDAPAPTFPSDWEIPDPEPTEEERRTHTLSLGKIGQNTIPISVEEILKSETPEERRIRILSNASATKMSDLQRQIFTYFARIPGIDTQILEAVTGVYKYAGEKTSRKGNIAVMGAAGTGKTRLSYGLIVMMCKDMGLDAVKTARVTGERMNELDPATVVAKLSGGFLSIENASDMSAETIAKLSQAMEFKTDCMILIIEDEKNAIRAMFKKYPEFADKFTGTVSIPAFTNDELVTFARTYCAENNCELDEMGVLALYSMISNSQSEEQPVSITTVKEMVDSAISHAKRNGRKGRKGPKGKTIVLYEKDFIV